LRGECTDLSEREAENTIFDLRKKADLFLQAGNTEEFDRIQITIGHLQKIYGAVKGRGVEQRKSLVRGSVVSDKTAEPAAAFL